MEIVRAQTGFCVGIVHAYRKMDETAAQENGPLIAIHDSPIGPWDTLRRIDNKDPQLLALYPNLERVSVAYNTGDLQPGDQVMLGFHGLPREVRGELNDRGVNIAKNMHCPFIAKLDETVDTYAASGFDIFIVGQRGTHHVNDAQKFAAAHGRECGVIEKLSDVDLIPREAGDRKFLLVGQVTGNTELWNAVVARVEAEKLPIRIKNTVCSDSFERQDEAREIAAKVDVVVLLPGLSAVAVQEVVSRVNPRMHVVSSKDDVRPEWFEGARSVGVVGGITVPKWSVDEVADHIEALTAAAV